METLRPHGYIKKIEKRGYAYIPKKLQDELGILQEETAEIPVFLNANVLFLVRKGAKRHEVLKGLEILVEDLKLRWKEGDQKWSTS